MKLKNLINDAINGNHELYDLVARANKEACITVDTLGRLQARLNGDGLRCHTDITIEELTSKVNHHANACVKAAERLRKEYGLVFSRYYDFSSRYEKVLLAVEIQEQFAEAVLEIEEAMAVN